MHTVRSLPIFLMAYLHRSPVDHTLDEMHGRLLNVLSSASARRQDKAIMSGLERQVVRFTLCPSPPTTHYATEAVPTRGRDNCAYGVSNCSITCVVFSLLYSAIPISSKISGGPYETTTDQHAGSKNHPLRSSRLLYTIALPTGLPQKSCIPT